MSDDQQVQDLRTAGEKAGRDWRDTVEKSIAEHNDLVELCRDLALVLDVTAAKVLDRNASCRMLMEWGKNHERARKVCSSAIEHAAKHLAEAVALSPIMEFDRREGILKLVTEGLRNQAAVGFPDCEWPDEALFGEVPR